MSPAAAIAALAAANFTVGTAAFIMSGILPAVAVGLDISLLQAGQSAAAFSVAFAVAAPVLAGPSSRFSRDSLVVWGLVLFCAGCAVTAGASNYTLLLLGRVLSGLGASLVTPHAATIASLIAGERQRGRAVALVLLGYAAATVAGVPLGAVLCAAYGWRTVLWFLTALGLLGLILVKLAVPGGLVVQRVVWSDWIRLLRSRAAALTLSVTALQVLGQATVLTYLAVLLMDGRNPSAGGVGALLFVFGFGCLVGLLLASRSLDRFGAAPVTWSAIASMAAAMCVWYFFHDSRWTVTACLLVWGLGSFSVNSAQQTKLIELSPGLATASLPLNSSASFAAQALGAVVGGHAVQAYGPRILPLVGCACLLLALLVSIRASAAAELRVASAVKA